MKKLFRISPQRGSRNPVVFSWQPEGNYLATASNAVVQIYNRHGERIDEINLSGSGRVLSLEWDKSGESLAVLQDENGQIPIWDLSTSKVQQLETNLRDPTFLKWSQTGSQLAIGTQKGNLLIFNKATKKKIPILAKHPRAITCGSWSSSNKLCLGSDDCTMTLSNDVGDTIEQTDLKFPPHGMTFSPSNGKQNLVSINMGGKSILLYNIYDPDNPVELSFEPDYGNVVSHKWFGVELLLIGFSRGQVVALNTKENEVAEELWSGRVHSSSLFGMAYSDSLNRGATAGDGGIKIIDMQGGEYKELKGEAISMDTSEEGRPHQIDWSPDGTILTVSTRSGYVYNFLAKMPMIHDHNGTNVAYLSSLREISVVDTVSRARPQAVPVHMEPTFTALGVGHVAVGMNNRIMYYRYGPDDTDKVGEQDYVGTVESVRLNDKFAAVLSDNQVTLHLIEPVKGGGPQRKTFPEREDDGGSYKCATALALTSHFLVYGTDSGTVEFFYLTEWAMLGGAELRHSCGIKSVYPNAQGTRLIVVDENDDGFLYNPVTGDFTPIPEFPANSTQVMWDKSDKNIVMVYDGGNLHTYVYAPITIRGPMVMKLGPLAIDSNGGIKMEPQSFPLSKGWVPILTHNGEITCQTAAGQLQAVTSPTYDHNDEKERNNKERQLLRFTQNLALLRLREAWSAALVLNKPRYWHALANKAMQVMDIEMAIRIYRQIGDAGMVMGLESLKYLEDKNLLAGHIALLFMDYSMAQDLFLSSSRPLSALEMRRDLLHWDQALKLATTLSPSSVPEISVEFAQQLEFKGEYENALKMYEAALNAMDEEGNLLATDAQQTTCMGGIARCTLRLGDLRRGVRLARESNDKKLCRECASILQSLKQWMEAASLYEIGEQYEKAAEIYIKQKDFTQASKIMGRVTLPKLHSLYGKACEQAGKFQDAAAAYKKAHDMDSVIRLCLDQLAQPDRAFSLVRESGSSTGADMVAKYCQKHDDFRGAIEFLLMASRSEEAFALAKSHVCMELYTSVLGDKISPDDAREVAHYYETQNSLGKAGQFYSMCGQYNRALKLFLQCGDKEVDNAIEVVGKARNDMLTHMLIDFLMGETDGQPKDPDYVYRLYMALGNFSEASKTAVIIAQQEQADGDYARAHKILYNTIHELELKNGYVSQQLRQMFVLLHSYQLVKKLAKRGDHEGTARLLLRVAKHISKFPKHEVRILISTIIECQKSGLKDAAYEWATYVCSNADYKADLAESKFKTKIQAIIRRPNKDSKPESLSPCPISGQNIRGTELECPTTKDQLPMCVCTGRHMEIEDWCFCPVSGLPALYSEYIKYLNAEASNSVDDMESAVDKATAVTGGAMMSKFKRMASKVVRALDPVKGEMVSSLDLKKASAEEAKEYIRRYNSVDQGNDGKKSQEGGVEEEAM
ncbi:hypothetical protein TrST_g1003 [Triparma strigata]|uniref:Uncharacterized protein n=1 Tax=Triparma strigata TaxID=1606541 RepID=A0A9W6ZW10_9STRA|nr:hypothetical protein TrST_g1003 [Triparma strigata]